MKKTLSYRVQTFLDGENSKDALESLLHDLIEEYSDDSLELVLKMSHDDYGGITYKAEYQTVACYCAVFWGKKGVDGLLNKLIKEPDFRSISNFTLLLGYLAANKFELYPFLRSNLYLIDNERLIRIAKSPDVILSAKNGLIDVMQRMPHEEIFPTGVLINLLYSGHKSVQKMIFVSLIARWFHFDRKEMELYWLLINQVNDEQVYHTFLENNKFLLDPLSVKIWSKPKFGEALIPDFLIRSIDNLYTIVEIEKPALPIITKNGNLSSAATHAKRQVLDYRDWAISNLLYIKDRFPGIWRPEGLVIIGMEKDLSEKQKEQLRKENESTQGIVKIVGFDWLYNRTESIFNNLIEDSF